MEKKQLQHIPELSTAFELLKNYVEAENFKGYDPYDTLLSRFPFRSLGKWPPVVAIQLQKRNPINIRPLLGIKKAYNPKAIGLFLYAYSLLYKKTGNVAYRKQADFFFDWLGGNYSQGYAGMSWGYNFPWASPVKYLAPFVPTAVVTGFVVRGVYMYFQVTNSEKAKGVLKSAAEFIKSDLEQTVDDTGVCISYSPEERDVCYNASLLAGEVLAYNYAVNGALEDGKLARNTVDFVLNKQKENGLWAYSEKNGKERIQTDFHQGYVLESIFRIKQAIAGTGIALSNTEEMAWMASLTKGLEYYREVQFFDSGQSQWRVPKEWPIEIHNQAQGIITFSLFENSTEGYTNFAQRIAQFTVDEMQDVNGYFYYHKYKYHTHKIPYMRWSQAWMFVAFATLLD